MPWDQGPGLWCPGGLVPGFASKSETSTSPITLPCFLMDSTLPHPIHRHTKDPVITNLLDVLYDEDIDEVHRFLLPDGRRIRVVSFPSSCTCSCPINELVEFWDNLGSEILAVCQRGFLETTRFGPDVPLTILYCHEDVLVNLLIVKVVHGKTGRSTALDHCSCVTLLCATLVRDRVSRVT
jgi:hypothetical protein